MKRDNLRRKFIPRDRFFRDFGDSIWFLGLITMEGTKRYNGIDFREEFWKYLGKNSDS